MLPSHFTLGLPYLWTSIVKHKLSHLIAVQWTVQSDLSHNFSRANHQFGGGGGGATSNGLTPDVWLGSNPDGGGGGMLKFCPVVGGGGGGAAALGIVWTGGGTCCQGTDDILAGGGGGACCQLDCEEGGGGGTAPENKHIQCIKFSSLFELKHA